MKTRDTERTYSADYPMLPAMPAELHDLNVLAEANFIQDTDNRNVRSALTRAGKVLGWTPLQNQNPATSPIGRTLFYRVHWSGESRTEDLRFCVGYWRGYPEEWTPDLGFDGDLLAWFDTLPPFDPPAEIDCDPVNF